MRKTRHLLVTAMFAAGVPFGMGVAPLRASAATRSVEWAQTQCVLKPGTYAIVDPATGKTVGILLVYPDCRTEIISVDHVPAEGWEG